MFIRNLINHIKINKIIKNVIKEENLLGNLSELFSNENYKVNFKQDWIGRIYAVVNPIVQNPHARIFEYTPEGENITSFVNKWVIEHMIAADTFVKNHQLFDILTYELKQLDEDYNFLITLTPITWFDFWKSMKRLLFIGIPVLIALITTLIIVL